MCGGLGSWQSNEEGQTDNRQYTGERQKKEVKKKRRGRRKGN